ncbi:FAD-dependent oxidoreductase [Nocardioides salsibiostraticola]
MPYVVTQSCCADASCVVACPVNCIHPAPGEPGFAEAEMLYIDANSCVDCGACVTACPAAAIKPHTALKPSEEPFLALNADYFATFADPGRTPLAVVPAQRRVLRPGPFRVAVIGAGPAGLYTADELLKHPEFSVDVFDRLPTPYGLVRAGVAPDHQRTKKIQELFAHIENQPGFRYLLNVEIGAGIRHDDLVENYDAVVYSVGASSDRVLGIPGEPTRGSLSATDFVGWYNGHPDKVGLDVPLDQERAVIIGNGNVALDVARILTTDPAELAHTDLAVEAWQHLAASSVREVVILGRRGPEYAAFTLPELIGLAGLSDRNVIMELTDDDRDRLGEDTRGRVIRELADRRVDPARRTIRLRFHTPPACIVGEERVQGLEVASGEVIEAGLVLRAIGYRGQPVADLPYDAATGTVPHDHGRVVPGTYVAGWIKRGPSGFIGTNKSDAEETVAALLDDCDSGAITPGGHTPGSIDLLLRARKVSVVDRAGWRSIDREERRRGHERGAVRTKIVDSAEAVRIAADLRGPRTRRIDDARRQSRRYPAPQEREPQRS